MTPAEHHDYQSLVQRLYGGPADGEEGDMVQVKREVAEISRTIARWDGYAKAIVGIVSFLGLAGFVAIVRGLGL